MTLLTLLCGLGMLAAAIASGVEPLVTMTDETTPRTAVENVTCIPPLLGNRCLGISCLTGCGDPITDLGVMVHGLNVPPSQFTAFGLKSCSINRLNFALELTHESVGDLVASLSHQGTRVDLYDPADDCAATAVDAVWSDQGAGPANACPATGSGTFLPSQPLAAFTGAQLVGTWTLRIEDRLASNAGAVERWRFAVDASCIPLEPPPPPPPPTPPCVSGETTLCLGPADRFRVEASFEDHHGASGAGRTVELTDDTGYLWFFDAENVELVIKVLDGCAITGHWWVFAGGLTNVEVALTVTDTKAGAMKIYTNPLRSPFQPIQDTAAFATCP
jgi:hypothetical protein